jgi:phosphatidate cytidylyltransferase
VGIGLARRPVALGNLAQRFLVAVVAVPILFFILYFFKRAEPAWILIALAATLAMHEFFAMTMQGEDNARDRRAALIIGVAACAALYWLSPMALPGKHAASLAMAGPLAAITIAVLGTGLYYLFRFRDMASAAQRFAFSLTGIIYCGFTFTVLAMFKRDIPTQGADFIILVLAIAWVSDTGAYFAGRFLGNSKLYPAVSPKKTWAGAVGGLAGSIAGAAAMKLLRIEGLSWLDVALIAIPGGILGQLGDLAESLIKRSVGVKDSGALLPGHGGILDRIDAVLFIAPYVYVYVMLISPLIH